MELDEEEERELDEIWRKAMERAKQEKERPDYVDTHEEDNIPLFMDKIPENIEGNDTLLALQDLVHDQTPNEKAEYYKNLGNQEVKRGKYYYREAIDLYTQGIDQNAPEKQINSILYSNRAQINLFLENYGKVISDSKKSIIYDTNNIKSYYRGAKAANILNKAEEALIFCLEGLKIDTNNKELQTEKLKAEEIIEIKKERRAVKKNS